MALSLTVNGVTQSAIAFSLSINDNINSRSTAVFSIDTDETITVGQEVIIMDGATKIFGGTIDSYTLSYLRGGTEATRRRYNINAIDFNQIADRRRVAASYENQTVSYIVNDIVTNFLAGEGVTVGTITNGSTVIKQAVFNYIRVTDALDYIKDITALNWNIDFEKELTLFAREDNLGVAFTDANCLNMTLTETRKDYRNSQLVRAGDSTTEVIVKEDVSPKPDGVSRTFTGRFPVATKPTIYVNDVAVADSDVGINGLDSGKKWYWQKNSKDITQDPSETVLNATDTLTKSYQGLKPIIVQADNSSGQNSRASIEGGTGIYQELETQKSIDDQNAAIEYANGLLQKYGEIPRKISIVSDVKRSAGNIIQVTSDNLGINEDFLITNVNIIDLDGCGTLRYNISGDSGEDVGTWIDFFRNLKPVEFVIRDNEVLVLLQDITEITGWTGTSNIQVFDALYPSDTLYPSETLYPNGNVQEEYNVLD